MSEVMWLGGNHDEVRRAFAAYFRSEGAPEPHGGPVDQPSGDSYLCERDGKRYVVLLGGRQDGPLRVYRIRNDGMLRRMRRWPKEIIDDQA